MPVAVERSPARFEERPGGGWWFAGWAAPRVVAGVTGRDLRLADLLGELQAPVTTVDAEQVHGAGVAVVGERPTARPIPGCDALVTGSRGMALLVRCADCLPILFADADRAVVGAAHVGWRGLAASLPARVVATFRHVFHSRPADLHVAIGPCIRGCCYEVGRDFPVSFAPFIQERARRRTCDLVAAAAEQLRACGIPEARLTDAQRCTACEPQRWYSLRREGPAAGRLTALIVVKP
jgi:hypothetical protein